MERKDLHELTAAYALDAIGDEDASIYEEHLRRCEQCRHDLAAFQETASTLAFAAPPATVPVALRERILDQARSERSNVVPLPTRRWAPRVATAAAAMAAAVAVGVGLWAADLSSTLSEERQARARLGTVAQIVADPNATRLAVDGEEGVLVVSSGGDSALLLSELDPPPAGKTYQAWVIDGSTPLPAGVFEPEGRSAALVLNRRVPRGSTVAVTIEPDGGLPAPSGQPIFTAETA